ncbi:MAG: urease accessory protein UreD [Pseudomonadota bacterium]
MSVQAMGEAGYSLQPRARGALRLSSKARGAASVLDDLYMSGALRAVFPGGDALQAVLVNTAGGITGGDTFDIAATAGRGTTLTLTTQAAERAYRAQPGEVGTLRTRLEVEEGARLDWLPQETILFDGCHLDRALDVDLAEDARLLIVEPMIWGRTAMGETRVTGTMRERIHIRRGGALLYADQWRMDGDLTAQMDRPAVGGGARAMASVLYVGPDAEARRDALRPLLGPAGGLSLRSPSLLVGRLLAPGGYDLRKALIPLLTRLHDAPMPTPWRL